MIKLLENLEYKYVTVGRAKVEDLEPRLNFLFVVYNEVEMSEMQKYLTPLNGFEVILDYVEEESMQHFFIGKFFKYSIVLTKTSDMGGGNVNSVINVINKAIQIFRPGYIVMPGIAAGLSDKIKIGDVVIADKIIGYESEKIGASELIGRYPEFRSPRLFNLFCSANVQTFNLFLQSEIQGELEKEAKQHANKPDCETNCPKDAKSTFLWSDFISNNLFPKVYTGNFISGEKLLDNPQYRGYLKMKFKEAMALDMEGVGVASASTFNRVYDWLVIKGISDLGDGNKGENKTARQIFSMKNVITVLKRVFDNELSFPSVSLKQMKGFERKNVLISASQCSNGEFADATYCFMEELSRELILNQYNILTGYGKGVGPAVLFGIFDGCDILKLSSEEYMDRFQTFAFPRNDYDNNHYKNQDDKFFQAKLKKCKNKNREILCANAKIAIFAFGNKERAGDFTDNADGMFEELELVAKNKALILPVGCTGGTAHKIYERVIDNADYYLKPYFSERNYYRDTTLDSDEEMRCFVQGLKRLNKIDIESTKISLTVKKVLELINLYA